MEWWWIDYLENELNHSMEADVLTLLENSETDRTHFEQCRLLKQWVRESDPVAAWPLDDRISRVHQNIMASVADLEIEPVP